VFLALLGLVLGCKGPQLGEGLAGVSSLSELDGVWLGQPAVELRSIRPNVTVQNYSGYSESLGGSRAVYEFCCLVTEGQEPANQSPLLAVEIVRTFKGGAMAPQAEWERLLREARQSREADECLRMEGRWSGVFCFWSVAGDTLSLSLLTHGERGESIVTVRFGSRPPILGGTMHSFSSVLPSSL
jgi:hypothetical protein